MALDSVLYDKVNELMGNNLPFIQTGNVIEQYNVFDMKQVEASLNM